MSVTKLKAILSNNKKPIMAAFLHAGLMWASLIFAYNTYKEYIRGLHNINVFPMELKIAIKSTFPWAILIFMTLYFLYGVWTYKKDNYPTFKQYGILITLYLFFVNIIFFSKGTGVWVVLNLSSIYLVLLLFIWNGIKKIIPPEARGGVSLLIINFTILFLLIISSFPLISEYKKEDLAHIAYFLLVIWAGIEVYYMIKYGKDSEK